MTPTRDGPPTAAPRRRADAERSVAGIMYAALDALASDPEASMAEIARRAGVVRATIYVHFPTRDALIAAVTDRGIPRPSRRSRPPSPSAATRPTPYDESSRRPGAPSGATTR